MPLGVPAVFVSETVGVCANGVVTELEDVTAAPVGGVPVAVAVLVTVPASTSSCVSVYVLVQVVVAPGASVATGQLTGPTFGSETPTLVSVTLPEFCTPNVYVRVEPAVVPVGVPAVLVIVITGAAATGVSVESVAVIALPVGGVPVAVAVFATWPESTSACVSVYVFAQVALAPGASVVGEQVIAPTLASVTPTAVSVTLPEFVMTNV
jgi:hypothetical protein